MAYVIAVCGSGGKTTFCKNKAQQLAKDNKKVCITTTTNMWFDEDVKNNYLNIETMFADSFKFEKVYYVGNIDEKKKKLTPLDESGYRKICETFDYIIIEADGSRAMPMKIPNSGEPIIPINVNEIVIVVGMESVGREIGYICHRFDEFGEIEKSTIVTEELIDDFVNRYYYEPLSKSFPKAKINIYKNDYTKISSRLSSTHTYKVCIAICAAGFSKRFDNQNKLFVKIGKFKLYQLMIEKMIATREMVLKKLSEEIGVRNIEIEIAVITQYDEILNDEEYKSKVTFIKNTNANLGLSSSIKIAIDNYNSFDAVMFINSDKPKLDEEELTRFLFYSILNKNKMASMFTDKPENPAYFEKEYFADIMKIEGDTGPREILNNNIKDLYRYYINPDKLFDIDTMEDYKKLKEQNGF